MNHCLILLFFLLGILPLNGQKEINIPSPKAIEETIRTAREQGDFALLAQAYYWRALAFKGVNFQTAEVLDDLKQSATYYRYIRDTIGYHNVRMTLAESYGSNEIYYNDAIEMTEEAAAYYKSKSLADYEAKAYTLLGKIFTKKQDYQLALDNIVRAMEINKVLNDTIVEIENGILVSNILALQGNVERAIDIAIANRKKIQKVGRKDLEIDCLYNLARFYLLLDEDDLALNTALEALVIGDVSNKQRALMYHLISDCYKKNENPQKALEFQTKFINLSDTLSNYERMQMINRLTLQYQTLEKEREIIALEREQKQREEKLKEKNRLLASLIFGLVLFLIAGFYIVRFYKQKIRVNEILSTQQREIDSQKIIGLQNEVKIKSLESMVMGQEEERERIASDLHDSLGGMLSTIKLQFDAIEIEQNEVERNAFDNIHHMIDEACAEVRDIARNLKPAALQKMGIKAAIGDLINRFESKTNTEISFYANDLDGKLSPEIKLHVYRIIQELLNNAVKHSQANEIDLQLNIRGDELVLVVEDDGTGFDIASVEKGLGMDNIYSRVNVLKGEISFDSKIGQGTSILIHIPMDHKFHPQSNSDPSVFKVTT